MRSVAAQVAAAVVATVVLLSPIPAAGTSARAPASVASVFARRGPFATTSVTVRQGSATYVIFRPAHYHRLGFRSPIVTWGNGTNATPSRYTTLLGHFASYGFTVIASTLTNTGSGREIDAAAQYLVQAGRTRGTVFAGRLDLRAVAAVGHSQGATGAVRAATMDPHLVTSVMTFSLPDSKWSAPNPDCALKTDCEAHPAQLKQPVFFIATHGPLDAIIAGPANERADYERVRGRAALGLIAVSGGRTADHNSVQDTAVGGNPQGEMGFATAWLEYTLRHDKRAAAAFTGRHPQLVTNPAWPGSMVKS